MKKIRKTTVRILIGILLLIISIFINKNSIILPLFMITGIWLIAYNIVLKVEQNI